MIVFSQQWFEHHQRPLLWFVNRWIGKRFFRISGDAPKGKRIVKFLPNCYTWEERKEKDRTVYATDFRTHDKFAKRLYYGLKPVWYLFHFIDWLFSFSPVPQLRLNPQGGLLGFDTLPFYPDEGSGGTTCDGYVKRLTGAAGEDFSVLRSGAGTGADVGEAVLSVKLDSSKISANKFVEIRRSILVFDTSILSEATLHSAIFSEYGAGKTNPLGLSDVAAGMALVGATPASDTNLAPSDYSQVGATRYATDIPYSAFSTSGYNEHALNGAGLAAIDTEGNSHFGLRLAIDLDAGAPSSPGVGEETSLNSYSADQTGENQDPRLVVTFDPGYGLLKDKRTGISPVWIKKINFATAPVYLSDRAFTIVGWTDEGGDITTLPWVDDFQPIDGDIAEGLKTFPVSDMTLDIKVDPDASPNWRDLISNPTNSPETTECTLFLWFEGLDASTSPPKPKWVGNILNPHRRNELMYRVNFVDESLQLNAPLGTLLDPADFPGADPDDIGKMIPIVYGDVKDVPALAIDAGVVTTLATDTTAVATSLSLTSTTGYGTGTVLQIEGEQILVGDTSGNLVTGCTRGYNGTTATTHDKGMQVWEVQTEYWYILANHPVKAINSVYVDGVRQAGSDFTVYTDHSGKAKIKFDTRPVLEKSIDVEVDDNVDVTDYALSHNDGISHNASVTENQTDDLLYDYASPQNWAEGTSNYKPVARFTHPGFAYGEIQVKINASLALEGGTNDKTFYCRLRQGGTTSSWQVLGFRVGSSPPTTEWTWYNPVLLEFSSISSGDTYIDVYHTGSDEVDNWDTLVCTRTAKADATVTGTGSSSKDDAIKDKIDGGKSYFIGLTGNSSADVVIGERVTADVEGYQDDGSGTYTGTPNALIERPDHVFKHFLAVHCNYTAFYTDAAGNFDANSYKFAGTMNIEKSKRDWLKQLAWECRCRFRLTAGEARLTWWADTISSEKTIDASMIERLADGFSSMDGPWKSPLHEVLNSFNIRYNRDWTMNGDTAYRGLKPFSDATSIADYGAKSPKGLFNFDFVTDGDMAAHVGAFRLLKHKDRKDSFKWVTWLMNEELTFGTGVTLATQGDLLCEVIKPDFYPGSGKRDRIDKITVYVKED